MAKKLYEFSALLNYHYVVAADSEKAAQAEIKSYEKSWLNGDFVAVSDVQLVDVRKCKRKDLTENAHIVV